MNKIVQKIHYINTKYFRILLMIKFLENLLFLCIAGAIGLWSVDGAFLFQKEDSAGLDVAKRIKAPALLSWFHFRFHKPPTHPPNPGKFQVLS